MWQRLKSWAQKLKTETFALYFAYRDPRTPWYAKAIAAFVVVYTFSPIDLIPDFIPVLGYLDDLIITPLGLALAIRLIPTEVMDAARQQVVEGIKDPRASRAGLFIVIGFWLIGLLMAGFFIWRLFDAH
jgi:uncharacterized membrane protein YkvA (DUF1232 family)